MGLHRVEEGRLKFRFEVLAMTMASGGFLTLQINTLPAERQHWVLEAS